MMGWIKKQELTTYYLQETYFIDKDKHWLRVKEKNFFQANSPQKQAE
jgi:hypothetical protein